MIPIVFLGLLAFAAAAPHWNHHRYHHGRPPFEDNLERYLDRQMFDTERFWDDFSRELEREMRELDTMLTNFGRHFPSMVSNEGIVGNEYRITIPLIGFEEKDIVVKARKGLLMVQAIHAVDGHNQNNYLDIRTLPACVKEGGSWSYKDNVLKIVLPVDQDSTGAEETTAVSATPGPDYSREETEKPADNLPENADIGLERGDLAPSNDLLTNEIPKVEATTYAVDLKDEVEFVPVQYK